LIAHHKECRCPEEEDEGATEPEVQEALEEEGVSSVSSRPDALGRPPPHDRALVVPGTPGFVQNVAPLLPRDNLTNENMIEIARIASERYMEHRRQQQEGRRLDQEARLHRDAQAVEGRRLEQEARRLEEAARQYEEAQTRAHVEAALLRAQNGNMTFGAMVL
jgi:hypothetical protein